MQSDIAYCVFLCRTCWEISGINAKGKFMESSTCESSEKDEGMLQISSRGGWTLFSAGADLGFCWGSGSVGVVLTSGHPISSSSILASPL